MNRIEILLRALCAPAVRFSGLLRQMVRTHEFVVAGCVLVLSIVVGLINTAYFTLGNLFDLLRNATTYGILAMGVLVVLISGGVDVSFPAIAAASSYIAVKILIASGFQGSAPVVYALAMPFGFAFGLLNATLISRFRLPALIVTLGTAGMIYGFVLFFIGNLVLYNLPSGLVKYGAASLMTVEDAAAGTSALHPAVLLLVGAAAAVAILLKYTMAGRGVFALGGNREAAIRSGFNIRLIEYGIYCLAGVLAAIAGVTQVALFRNANPAALMGAETGTLLGLSLITILKSSLVLVGIPSEWQKVAIGCVLLIGITVPVIRLHRQQRVAAGDGI
ncbi:MAG: putative transporter permease protein [Acidobacteria bacterium]|nr:putative transporter permease protein [Acidobacteriota bacterium]